MKTRYQIKPMTQKSEKEDLRLKSAATHPFIKYIFINIFTFTYDDDLIVCGLDLHCVYCYAWTIQAFKVSDTLHCHVKFQVSLSNEIHYSLKMFKLFNNLFNKIKGIISKYMFIIRSILE